MFFGFGVAGCALGFNQFLDGFLLSLSFLFIFALLFSSDRFLSKPPIRHFFRGDRGCRNGSICHNYLLSGGFDLSSSFTTKAPT